MPFAVAGELRQLLLHRLLVLQSGLARVEQRGADHHVRQLDVALDEGEGAVAVQRGADEAGRLGVAVEQHVVPRDQHVVEDQQRVDFIEAIGERIILDGGAAGEAVAADEFQVRRAQVADEANCVVRQLGVAPVGDGWLGESLVGVSRGGFVFRAAHDDAGIGLLDHVQQHVGVLVLRTLGPVALGIGVGRDMERVLAHHTVHMAADVSGELRVDLVQHVLAVVERPHLADRFIADAGDDAADLVEHGVHRLHAWHASPAASAAAWCRPSRGSPVSSW